MNYEWLNRATNPPANSEEALKFVSHQVAYLIARYCRRYVDYCDPYGEYRRESQDSEETLDDGPEAEAEAFRSPSMLRAGLTEVGEFAEAYGIPFSVDAQFNIGLAMLTENDDVWNNSSIGC